MLDENPEEIDPAPPSGRGLGLSSLLLAAALGAILSALLIWLNDLSVLWAILFYPAIGTVLTFLFAAVRIKWGTQAAMPRS